MAKEIDKIIISSNAPKSKNVGWFNGQELKLHNKGVWSSVGGSSNNNGQIYTMPAQVMEALKTLEIEGEHISALSLKDAEAIFKEDWNTVFKKWSEYAFIIFPPYIPVHYYNTLAFGAPIEEGMITMMFYNPDGNPISAAMTNSYEALEIDGEKYIMYLVMPQ